MTWSLDISRFRQKMGRMGRSRPQARRQAALSAARVTMKRVIDHWPRDTNRSVRGWMQAANEIGAGPYLLPPVTQSQRAEHNLERLLQQRAFWHGRVRALERAGRVFYKGTRRVSSGRARRGTCGKASAAGRRRTGVTKDYKLAMRRLKQAEEQLKNYDESAIIIGGRKLKRGGVGATRAISKLYGGEGRIIETADATMFEVRNREPHAQIVERKTKVLSRSLRQIKQTDGMRRVSAKYLREIEQASGFKKTG